MGGVAHISLDGETYRVISNVMGRMIFDLTDEDRVSLEFLRQRLGHRSQAETLRQLIREAASKPVDDDAPEWTDEVFRRAAIIKGGEVIRPASGTLTKGGNQSAVQIGPKAYKPGDLAKRGKGK